MTAASFCSALAATVNDDVVEHALHGERPDAQSRAIAGAKNAHTCQRRIEDTLQIDAFTLAISVDAQIAQLHRIEMPFETQYMLGRIRPREFAAYGAVSRS